MTIAAKTAAGMSSVQTSAKDTVNTVAVAATVASGAYVQAQVQSIVDLANDLRLILINAGLA